ncbi:MAG: hypothetical protein RIS08_437 [Actinomycetota bacterium]
MAERNRMRLETGLAYTATSLIAVSILSIFATLLSALFEAETIPPLIVQLPLIGLPIGFFLIIVLLVLSVIRRSKENRN